MFTIPRHSAPRSAGHTQSTLLDGSEVVRDTLQCVHCQAHWEVVPGSGRRRGWCLKCNGPVCGKDACLAGCTPAEQMLENLEAGRPADYRPIIVRASAP